ncbi:MAG TPA: 23S rRNA (adenine(2503)-C(2))-methyltransferase RlmN [Rhodothermia bacterium]
MASGSGSDEQPRDASGRARLSSLDRAGFEAFALSLGLPAFRGRQLFTWIQGKGVASFAEMTDLPETLRASLDGLAVIERVVEVSRAASSDGTVKSLMMLSSGAKIETVLIPDFSDDGPSRMTACVSSQVGCAMGCTFCATGLMGFSQNLTAGEIVDQVRFMDGLARSLYDSPLTNVVYMGMGEPLMNYREVLKSVSIIGCQDVLGMSPKRVTVSTVGLAKRIEQLADDAAPFNLAISLHSAINEKRSRIMPVNRSERTDIAALRRAVGSYHAKTRRRVTYEYCMLKDFNDSDEDAEALAKAAHWAPSKVNLIMYNAVPGSGFEPTPPDRLNRFIKILVDRNVKVTVRRSRGQDIAAACGQLVVRETEAAT